MHMVMEGEAYGVFVEGRVQDLCREAVKEKG